MAFLDCDVFKAINDRYGHQAGDEVLALLGRILSESVREGTDYPFRLGGDEFCVIFRGLDEDGAHTARDRVRRRFKEEKPFGATISIGLAFIREASMEALAGPCDQALYRAKGLGGDRVELESSPVAGQKARP